MEVDVAGPVPAGPVQPSAAQQLSPQELYALFQDVIKMASENKINENNAWDITFIDHLPALVQQQDAVSINFQAASCGLNAGVTIYGKRVDSTYKLAHNVLHGYMNEQTGSTEQKDEAGQRGSTEQEGEASQGGSTTSTLECNPEALNAKGVSNAALVDPLFHRTSALFGQGSAQGLLVNNLSAWVGCEILFDSGHCPEELVANAPQTCSVQVAVADMLWRFQPSMASGEVTPSLHVLLDMCEGTQEELTGWDNLQLEPDSPGPCSRPRQHSADPQPAADGSIGTAVDGEGACPPSSSSCSSDAITPEDDDPNNMHARGEDLDDLALYAGDDSGDGYGGDEDDGNNLGVEPPGLGDAADADSADNELHQLWEAEQLLVQQQSAKGWAGPAAWRPVTLRQHNAAAQPARREPSKRGAAAMLELIDVPDRDELLAAEAFQPSDRPGKRTARARQPVAVLPKDTGYKVAGLFGLSLCPSQRHSSGAGTSKDERGSTAQGNARASGEDAGWGSSGWDGAVDDDDGGGGPEYECPEDASNAEDELQLMAAPREVARLTVSFSSMQKQVDIKALKTHLWGSFERTAAEVAEVGVSFQQIISKVPAVSAAGKVEDISVHLCFISLLHLANEHGLRLKSSPTLDSLQVYASA